MINYIELLGYAAMVLVVVSFLFKSPYYIRLINLMGAICFTAYGLLLPAPAYPIIITNVILSIVQIYFLWQLAKQKKIK